MNTFNKYLEAAKSYYSNASWTSRLLKDLKKAYPDEKFYTKDQFIRIKRSKFNNPDAIKGTLVVDIQGTIGNSYAKAKERAFITMKHLEKFLKEDKEKENESAE